MRVPGALAAALALASSSIEAFAGEERFRSPLTIPDVPHPASIQAGDFNKDGKLDLVTANGSELLLVLLQGRSDRQSWKTVPVSVGVSCYFALAGDFDGDGADDLMAADNGSTAYFIRSNGDGTFAPPAAIPQSRGPRWIVAGDWNKDGRLDFASTNITTGTLTVFVGDASDGFRLTQNLPASEQHVVELLDYDGDGAQDLALSGGGGGFLLLKGLGDGTFKARAAPITALGCVDYIQAADFNKDGKGDIATTCAATGGFSAAGISKGDGTFEKTWSDSPSGVLEPLAIGDLDADGNRDLVVANVKRTFFGVYPGKGDGALSSPPILFGPTGDAPEFLLARDLDDDGRQDIVSADNESSTLSVFWGREGSPFLEGGYAVSGYGSSKGFTVADLDRDGKLDFFFPSSERAEILVYLRPGDGPLAEKSFSIQTAFKYTAIDTADLNEDGIPDLIGIDRVNGKALVSLLSADGKAHDELSLDAGLLPSAIATGLLEEGTPRVDLVVSLSGSNELAVFLGLGGGKFANAKKAPTIERPAGISVGQLDEDGAPDLLVYSSRAVAVHYGQGGDVLAEPVTLLQDDLKTYTGAAIGDLHGDGIRDVAASESTRKAVTILGGKGGRKFEEAVVLQAGLDAPSSLVLFDVNEDGLTDITTSSTKAQLISILPNKLGQGFAEAELHRVGVPLTDYRFADLDNMGASDLIAFSPSSTVVLKGNKPPPPPELFRRGDTDGDGAVAINDPVSLLNWLFRGGLAPSCQDAADADDDGRLNLTDAIFVLRWLFLGGPEPRPPGPAVCGVDPGEDSLPPCSGQCQR